MDEARGPEARSRAEVAGRVALRFTGGPQTGGHVDLTGVHASGDHLWVAGDETPAVERLVLDAAVAPSRAGRQRTFRLAHFVQLPGAATGESDVQGIAGDDGWLWVIGSHALVRRRPKPEHDDAKVVRRLGKLRRDPNRFVIVRLALQLGVDRRPEPVRVARDGRRSALVGAPGAESLVDLLRADPHLAPFLAIPGQDNGFHVGGLAVVGERLFVGLRGPVLRGWAVVLELRPVQDPTDPGRLALGIFPEGARYRKHFLDLDGLGVADLCTDASTANGSGDADLLVLAAPTMVLSGPVRVHRWSGAAAAGRVVPAGLLSVEMEPGHGAGEDHACGITLLPPDPLDPRARLLVVHDLPGPDRRPWPDTVLADRVRIGPEPRHEPAPGNRVADDPATHDPEADDQQAHDPGANHPVAHGPVTNDTAPNHPAAHDSTADDSTADDSAANDPRAHGPVAHGPVAHGPVAEDLLGSYAAGADPVGRDRAMALADEADAHRAEPRPAGSSDGPEPADEPADAPPRGPSREP